MRIAFISSEVSPFSKTGGLADVSGTLPAALAALGHEVVVITPMYAVVDRNRHGLRQIFGRGQIPGLGGADVWEGRLGGRVRVLLIGAAAFDRHGLYQDNGRDFPDNDERFSFFSNASLLLLKHIDFPPDVLHVNDWQTALAPVYLKTRHLSDGFFSGTGTLLSIHNMAYQGHFHASRWRALALPPHLFRADALEFYGKINFLKGGIVFSDVLTTVSPRYAREIQSPGGGCGLDGILTSRGAALTGILNGIDYAEWNPAKGNGLFPAYSADRLEGKAVAKKNLLEKFGLPAGGPGAVAPLFGAVMRLDPQKGCDILLRALFRLLPKTDAQFVMLGTGSRDLEAAFSNLAQKFPGRVGLALKFDAAQALLVYAGSDFFLMPSKYEPCGLGQMIAMAYGTVPIVRLTGGLADTVKPFDEKTEVGNGFGFTSYTAESMNAAIQKPLQLFRNSEIFAIIQKNAMKERFTWEQAATGYVEQYVRAMNIRRKGGDDAMAVKAAEKSEAVSMIYEIGESAGKVYQYLSKKSEGESLPQITKGSGLDSEMSAMAVGWLSRENNVVVERSGRKIQVRMIKR